MRTPASIARHPIHPMLVPFPIGLWLFSFICDLAFVLGAGATHWATLAYYTMIAGVLGALLAAIPGLIDLVSLKGAPKKIALAHMALNVTIIVLYAVNIGTRIGGASVAGTPIVLSVIAVSLLAVSGWLGGHMVYVHRVAVDDGSTPSQG
jgi:uncharacterized membrane protein